MNCGMKLRIYSAHFQQSQENELNVTASLTKLYFILFFAQKPEEESL